MKLLLKCSRTKYCVFCIETHNLFDNSCAYREMTLGELMSQATKWPMIAGAQKVGQVSRLLREINDRDVYVEATIRTPRLVSSEEKSG